MDGKVTMKSKWTILFYTIMVYCSIYYKWFILAHPDFLVYDIKEAIQKAHW